MSPWPARSITASWPRSTTAVKRWNGTSGSPIHLVEGRPQHGQNGQVLRTPRPLLGLDQRRQAEHSHRPATGEPHLHRLAEQLFVTALRGRSCRGSRDRRGCRRSWCPARRCDGPQLPRSCGRPLPARRERPAAAHVLGRGGPRRGRPWSRARRAGCRRSCRRRRTRRPAAGGSQRTGRGALSSRISSADSTNSSTKRSRSSGVSRSIARICARSTPFSSMSGAAGGVVPGGGLHDAEITPGFPRGLSGNGKERERRPRANGSASDSLGAPLDRGAEGGHRIFFPSSEQSSSTPRVAVPLRWSRIGFVSTNSAETTLWVSASISMARWASR